MVNKSLDLSNICKIYKPTVYFGSKEFKLVG